MIRILPFLFGSFVIHTALVVCLECANLWSPQAAGSLEGNLDKVYVSVVANEELIACAPSPASKESAASTPTQATPKKQEESPDRLEDEHDPSPEPHDVQAPKPVEDPTPQPSQDQSIPPVLSEDATTTEIVKEPEKKQGHKPETEEKAKEQQKVEDKPPVTPSPASTPQIASEQSVSREAMGAHLHHFRLKIIGAIGKALYYPAKAFRKKQHGQTTVAFSVSKDGSLEKLQLITSSGSAYLDEAAEKIIRKASKEFPPIPKGLQKDRIDYVLPIVFKKKRAKRR